MSNYTCKICGKPLTMDFMSEKMMEFMDMPENGGAHAECLLKLTPVRANDKPSHKLAHPNPHPLNEEKFDENP